jgi:hypothetical protein
MGEILSATLFSRLCLYTGEKKILLHGQAAWATAGEQQRISLTVGEGAAHFISVYLENLPRDYNI